MGALSLGMTRNDIINIIVVGVGGQGVMTATQILAEAAIGQGFDAKKTEVAGMAQRGGVVSSHLRFGPRVRSPQISPGQADMLLGFEAAEALRWTHYLKPDGLAFVNTARLVPPVVNGGLYDYPQDPVRSMGDLGIQVRACDAMAIALELGDMRLGNTVMLGVISDRLPFPAGVLRESILARFRTRHPTWVEANGRAFDRGRSVVSATDRT